MSGSGDIVMMFPHCHLLSVSPNDPCFTLQSFLRMASAADIAKLETKAVAAEKLIELLRQQISQVRSLYPDGIEYI